MLEIELHVPPDAELSEQVVEAACAAQRLYPTLKGTLKTYPGGIHWHYQKAGQRGTLEITLWPRQRRLWFKVAAGRKGDWNDEAIARLKTSIEQTLIAGDRPLQS